MRRNKSRKNTALLLAILIIYTITACGREESNIRILEDVASQPEYLSFFSSINLSGSDVTKYWRDIFTERYNKKIYINFDGASYYAEEGLSYREILETRLESSSPDDLYIINAEDVLEFEKRGYWMDLSDMEFVNNLSEAALYQSTYNGKVFSVPLSFTGFGFLWNIDLLQEHGLSVPENLEEFMLTCEKLKNDGILPYGANKGYSLTVPVMCVGFSELYGSEARDAKITALNNGQEQVSSYMREGFAFLSDMIEKGYLDPEQALNTTPRQEDLELFLDKKCAFICAELSLLSELEESFQMEATGLPVLQDGCVAVYGANNRLCVNPNSPYLDTACEFVEMVGTVEALRKSAELGHSMSSAKDSGAAGIPRGQKLITLLQQQDQVPNQDFALHFNTWESIRDVSREICGGISIDEACDMLDGKQQEELKEYGK